jgi:hypothetical protein
MLFTICGPSSVSPVVESAVVVASVSVVGSPDVIVVVGDVVVGEAVVDGDVLVGVVSVVDTLVSSLVVPVLSPASVSATTDGRE